MAELCKRDSDWHFQNIQSINSKSKKNRLLLPVSAVNPPPDGWIQHSVPHGKLLQCNKIENFNYLNVAFISYRLTMWN